LTNPSSAIAPFTRGNPHSRSPAGSPTK
jgi:hypothetical protein